LATCSNKIEEIIEKINNFMDRNKFVRIFNRNNRIICCCCDTFVSRYRQKRCPPHTSCGCRPSSYSHNERRNYHVIKEEYNNFDNTKDKILATLLKCNMNERCAMSCEECNFTIARLKYLESIS